MTLLDNGAHYEACTVYPETTVVDVDGNTLTQASDTGFPALARFQPHGQSGTAARRAEMDKEGFESEEMYSCRFRRGEFEDLGAQSDVVWRGKRYSIFGPPSIHNGSPRTRHVTYVIKRS